MKRYVTWLYGIQSGLFIKIGITKDIKNRLREMNLYNPHPCKVVIRRQLEEAGKVERRMHAVLAPYAVGREWFMVDAKLAKAALKLVVDEVREERIAWQIECARREEEKRRRSTILVESTVEKN